MGSLKQKAKRAIGAILANAEPKHERFRAVVTNIQRDDSGAPQRATVKAGGATYTVDASSVYGLTQGAEVELEAIGSATSPRPVIRRITKRGYGAGSSDPIQLVNTPSFEQVASTFPMEVQVNRTDDSGNNIPDAGTILIRAWFPIASIPEQYAHNQVTEYKCQIREQASSQIVGEYISDRRPAIAGELAADVGSTDLSFTVSTSSVSLVTGVEAHPDFDPEWGIVTIEEEDILYESYDESTGTFTVYDDGMGTTGRGWNSTSATSHVSGKYVLGKSATVVADNLRPNLSHEIRARAIVHDGRKSNWTNWLPFVTDLDTTAPSWSGSVGLTAAAEPGLVTLEWNVVDTNATDLARYEVDISTDGGSTWLSDTGDQKDAGTGPRWVQEVTDTTARKYRVRAVDTSGNASSWSSVATLSWNQASWSGSRGLSVVGKHDAFAVTWNAVDQNVRFLKRYDVRVSPDDSTWTVYDAGNQTQFEHKEDPGVRRYFQVRAVDWDGTAGSWSSSVSDVTGVSRLPATAEQIQNTSFESNLNNWSETTTNGSISRTTADSKEGDASLLLELSTGTLSDVASAVHDDISLAAGRRVRLSAWVKEEDIPATAGVNLQLEFEDSGGSSTGGVGSTDIANIDGKAAWTYVEFEATAPTNTAVVIAKINLTDVGTNSGTIGIYVDDVSLRIVSD